MRRVTNWGRTNTSVLKMSGEIVNSISFEGSCEVKGTYFHPSIVLEVLEWVCPAFKQEIRSVYENFVCEQNV
jgi:hypothetical protein